MTTRIRHIRYKIISDFFKIFNLVSRGLNRALNPKVANYVQRQLSRDESDKGFEVAREAGDGSNYQGTVLTMRREPCLNKRILG